MQLATTLATTLGTIFVCVLILALLWMLLEGQPMAQNYNLQQIRSQSTQLAQRLTPVVTVTPYRRIP